jgi:Transposase IS200 like
VFSASSETRDRTAPTNANQIRLQTSGIRQEHRPIRYQLPARLSFRQGQVFRKLAQQKESRIEEGHLMPDHVHMMISIPPKICGLAGGRVYQGQECDPSGPCIRREETQFCGAALLGPRVLRLDRRPRRSGDTRIHQKPGARGQPPGPNEFVALIGHLQVANESRAASATLTAASSGPIPKAPGSAGGYLLTLARQRRVSPRGNPRLDWGRPLKEATQCSPEWDRDH